MGGRAGSNHGSVAIRVSTHWGEAQGVTTRCLCSQDTYLLEHICGGSAMFTNYESAAAKLINLVLPLCIRTGCGRRGG